MITIGAGLLAQDGAASGACRIPQTMPQRKPSVAGLVYEREAHGGQTTLDLYLPEEPKKASKPPMVMLVHGGWVEGCRQPPQGMPKMPLI